MKEEGDDCQCHYLLSAVHIVITVLMTLYSSDQNT